MKRTTLSIGLLIWLAISMILPGSRVARASCEADSAICAWTQRVVGIKTPNMIASGTLIGEGFVLTNRHVVEDHGNILIRLPDGEITRAQPIPHDVPVDLVLLRLRGTDKPLPRRDYAVPAHSPILTVVGFDQGRNHRVPMSQAPLPITPMQRCCHGPAFMPMRVRCPALVEVPCSMQLVSWLVFWQLVMAK